jgi:hypothetical protein
MNNTALLEKRRHQPRILAHMAAHIVPGRSVLCTVREVSPTGARLRLDGDWILPRGFWLRLVGDVQMHYCAVTWTGGGAVGVEFRPDQRSSWWHGQNIAQLPHRSPEVHEKGYLVAVDGDCL